MIPSGSREKDQDKKDEVIKRQRDRNGTLPFLQEGEQFYDKLP